MRGGPRTEEPRGERASDMMLPQVVIAVAAEFREEGGTQQGQIRTPLVWGEGIPLRPSRTIHWPADSVPSRAAPVDLLGRVASANMAISRIAPADTASRMLLPVGSGVHSSSAVSSVNGAITRLQR